MIVATILSLVIAAIICVYLDAGGFSERFHIKRHNDLISLKNAQELNISLSNCQELKGDLHCADGLSVVKTLVSSRIVSSSDEVLDELWLKNRGIQWDAKKGVFYADSSALSSPNLTRELELP